PSSAPTPGNTSLSDPAKTQAGGTSPSPQASALNSLRSPQSTTSPKTEPDRYASNTPTATPTFPPSITSTLPGTASVMTTNPADAPFAASWPAIQRALDRRDLKQAHQLLSKWHGNETLSPTETEKVETLLSQLAGTVIYSSEHQLEPARVVKPGESLESIAKEY